MRVLSGQVALKQRRDHEYGEEADAPPPRQPSVAASAGRRHGAARRLVGGAVQRVAASGSVLPGAEGRSRPKPYSSHSTRMCVSQAARRDPCSACGATGSEQPRSAARWRAPCGILPQGRLLGWGHVRVTCADCQLLVRIMFPSDPLLRPPSRQPGPPGQGRLQIAAACAKSGSRACISGAAAGGCPPPRVPAAWQPLVANLLVLRAQGLASALAAPASTSWSSLPCQPGRSAGGQRGKRLQRLQRLRQRPGAASVYEYKMNAVLSEQALERTVKMEKTTEPTPQRRVITMLGL